MDKLTDTQRDDALTRLSDWQAQGDAIVRTFKFRDFVRAIDFVNAIAEMIAKSVGLKLRASSGAAMFESPGSSEPEVIAPRPR